jgi:hypothetical protein
VDQELWEGPGEAVVFEVENAHHVGAQQLTCKREDALLSTCTGLNPTSTSPWRGVCLQTMDRINILYSKESLLGGM